MKFDAQKIMTEWLQQGRSKDVPSKHMSSYTAEARWGAETQYNLDQQEIERYRTLLHRAKETLGEYIADMSPLQVKFFKELNKEFGQ